MPARLPTEIKRLRGTLRRCRVNEREPAAVRGALRPSRHLSPLARSEFRRLVADIGPLNVLSRSDRILLELCAAALAEWRELDAVLQSEGRTYTTVTETGARMIRPRPEVALAADAWRRAVAGLMQFGGSPVARSKTTASPSEPDDERSRSALRFFGADARTRERDRLRREFGGGNR